MGWSVIRRATDEDWDRLYKAAERFTWRHNLPNWFDGRTYLDIVEGHIDCLTRPYVSDTDMERGRYLRKLWRACVKRALGDNRAEGIAYDHVGFTVRK